ncbi:MAG: transposase [Acidobacterium ailaaui]|nr:transposase [Pseudacidobacterium ailaaui]
MKHDPNKHHRRSIRLQGYDYSSPGAYFITICTQNRESLFGDVVDGEMVWNEFATIAQRCWLEIPCHFLNVSLDEYVIMPNHVHGIIIIGEQNVGARHGATHTIVGVRYIGARHAVPLPPPRIERFGKPTHGSIPTIVRSFKSAVAKRINEHRGTPGAPVWQRNYYEHIIGNDESLRRIRRYIAENPLRWHLNRENPRRTGKDDLWNSLFPEPRNAGQI